MPSIKVTQEKITFQRFLYVFLLCAFLAAAIFLINLLRLEYSRPFEKVAVRGDYEFVNKNLLKETIKKHADVGFFALDAENLKRALENLAWVKSAKVARLWPGKLQIDIKEQKPKFYWKNKGYFNVNGDLFVVKKLIDVGYLPVIDCSQKMTKKAVEKFQNIDAQLRDNNITISRFFIDEAAGVRLIIRSKQSNEFQVLLGNRHHDEKIQRFLLALNKGLVNQLKDVSSIDLRYSNGLAVAWNSPNAQTSALAGTSRSLMQ